MMFESATILSCSGHRVNNELLRSKQLKKPVPFPMRSFVASARVIVGNTLIGTKIRLCLLRLDSEVYW